MDCNDNDNDDDDDGDGDGDEDDDDDDNDDDDDDNDDDDDDDAGEYMTNQHAKQFQRILPLSAPTFVIYSGFIFVLFCDLP